MSIILAAGAATLIRNIIGMVIAVAIVLCGFIFYAHHHKDGDDK